MQEETSLPAFTLYQASADKYCFQSEALAMICSIKGPYSASRRQQSSSSPNSPTFNISISGLCTNGPSDLINPSAKQQAQDINNSTLNEKITNNKYHNNAEDLVTTLTTNLKNILLAIVLKEKYQRLSFDISFSIIKGGQNGYDNMLTSMINLLSFSVILGGIEVKSVFSCACVLLKDEKIVWDMAMEQKNSKKMILAIQSCDRQAINFSFQGQFVFTHYQRLANVLLDANQQIQAYIIRKIAQINDNQQ